MRFRGGEQRGGDAAGAIFRERSGGERRQRAHRYRVDAELYGKQWDYGGGGNVQRECDGERAAAGSGAVDGEFAGTRGGDDGGGGGNFGAGDLERRKLL